MKTTPATSSPRDISASIAGCAVSVFFIWLAFREIGLTSLWAALPQMPPAPIVSALLAQFGAFGLRLLRWGWALRRLSQVPWRRALSSGALGLAAIYLLPMRLGELVRPVLVAEKESGVRFQQALAAVASERFIDGLLISALFAVTAVMVGLDRPSAPLVRAGGAFAATFAALGLVLVLALQIQKRLSRRMECASANRLVRLLTRISERTEGFQGALRLMFGKGVLPGYFFLSCGIWGLELLSIYALFGLLPISLSPAAAGVLLFSLAAAVTLPSGPAQMGVFEFAIVLALGLFAVDRGRAALYAAILHALVTTVTLAGGLGALWLGKLSLVPTLAAARNRAQISADRTPRHLS